jgi:hypothetical protein
VAVIGSVFISVFRNGVGRHLSAAANAAYGSSVRESTGTAFALSKKLTASGHPALGAEIHRVASNAFIHGFHVGCLVASGVAALGVLLAILFLPAQPLVLAADLELDALDESLNGPVAVAAS